MKSLWGPRTSTMWCCDRRGKETAVSSRAANVNIQIFYFFSQRKSIFIITCSSAHVSAFAREQTDKQLRRRHEEERWGGRKGEEKKKNTPEHS